MKVKILSEHGRTIPLLFCDLCDKKIEDAKEGEYLIPSDIPDGEIGEGVIVGHFECTKRFEKAAFAKDETIYGNMNIEHLMFCLVSNTKTDITRAKASSDALEMIG